MLVGTIGTDSICGVLLEMAEKLERRTVEMGGGKREMPNRMIVYMATTDSLYDEIKVAHGDAVREFKVTSSQFACTAVVLSKRDIMNQRDCFP